LIPFQARSSQTDTRQSIVAHLENVIAPSVQNCLWGEWARSLLEMSGYAGLVRYVTNTFLFEIKIRSVMSQELLSEIADSDTLGGGEGNPLYGLYRQVQPQRYGFSAVINEVSILPDFGHFSHK